VDGLLTEANDIIVDESSMTGESHELYKNTIAKCIAHGTTDKKAPSPVIVSGSKIMSGEGHMICLLVGKDHRQGKLNELIQEDNDDQTPLEEKLEDLAEKIGLFGLFSGAILFVILVIWLFFSEIIPNGFNSSKHIADILGYLMLAVVIIVVAVPEGLPLAVTLSLAFSVKQMLHENNLVKRLACCETMGSAHVICTDKTGTLTQNDMHVMEIWNGETKRSNGFASAFTQHILNDKYKNLVFNAITNNSSAVLEPKIKGSPTEVALLRFAQDLYPSKNLLKERKSHEHNYFIRLPFNSDRKRITTGLKVDGVNYLFLTGASEIVLEACSDIYDVRDRHIGKAPINRQEIEDRIGDLTRRGLRVVAVAVKEIYGPLPDPDD
jgi:Ca2+ transporting ATPase